MATSKHITACLRNGYRITVLSSESPHPDLTPGRSFSSVLAFEEALQAALAVAPELGAHEIDWMLHTLDRLISYRGRLQLEASMTHIDIPQHIADHCAYILENPTWFYDLATHVAEQLHAAVPILRRERRDARTARLREEIRRAMQQSKTTTLPVSRAHLYDVGLALSCALLATPTTRPTARPRSGLVLLRGDA